MARYSGKETLESEAIVILPNMSGFPKPNPAQIATLAVMMLSLAVMIVGSLAITTPHLDRVAILVVFTNTALWLGVSVYVVSKKVERWWIRIPTSIALFVLSGVCLNVFLFIPGVSTFLMNDYEFAVRAAQGEPYNLQRVILPLHAASVAVMALPIFIVASWPEGGAKPASATPVTV